MSSFLGSLGSLTNAVSAVGGPMSGLAGDIGSGAGTMAGISGLLGTSGTGTRLPGSVVHARLANLQFAINPQSISLGKVSGTQGNKNPLVASAFQESVKSSGAMTIDLSGIQLMGPNTMRDALYLISLATPVPKSSAAAGLSGAASAIGGAAGGLGSVAPVTLNPSSIEPAAGGREDYVLAVVEFSWGMQLTRKVTVKSVDVNITRFSGQGVPISAEVGVKMQEWVSLVPGTNPTSGGLPGRAMHTVVAGDSVIGLAVRNYGDPSAWRAIAVANGLDDPLRVEPGRELYLPGPGELADVLAADEVFEVSGI
jgi:hypothetical protein